MAQHLEIVNERANTTILKLPCEITNQIIQALDADSGWRTLAEKAGYRFDQLKQLEFQLQKQGSPTNKLLWDLASNGYTANDLFKRLDDAGKVREKRLIFNWVYDVKKSGNAPGRNDNKSSDSLQSLFSQFGVSAHPPKGAMPSQLGGNGSSLVNFEHAHPAKGNAQMPKIKHYDDKVIPGTEEPAMKPECSIPFPIHLPSRPLPTEDDYTTGSGEISSVSSLIPNPPSVSGTDQIRRMMSQVSNVTEVSDVSQQEKDLRFQAKFSFQELSEATEEFAEINCIGSGAFGQVFRGSLRGIDCAVKRLKNPAEKEKDHSMVTGELKALLNYHHENIVTLYGFAYQWPEVCLVYQYLQNGSLEDRMFSKCDSEILTWGQRLNILQGSCCGLNVLHTLVEQQPLIHGDIKSANIFLDHHLEPKIGDLGLAEYANSKTMDTGGNTHITREQASTKEYGTIAFQAPENKSGSKMSIKSDIFAMGVVFLEVCSGLKAYDQNRNESRFLHEFFVNNIIQKTEEKRVLEFKDKATTDQISNQIFNQVLDLAARCTKSTKKQRPDSKKLLVEIRSINKSHKEAVPVLETTYSTMSEISNPNGMLADGDQNIYSPANSEVSSYSNRIIETQYMRYQEVRSPMLVPYRPDAGCQGEVVNGGNTFVAADLSTEEQNSSYKSLPMQIQAEYDMKKKNGMSAGEALPQSSYHFHAQETDYSSAQMPPKSDPAKMKYMREFDRVPYSTCVQQYSNSTNAQRPTTEPHKHSQNPVTASQSASLAGASQGTPLAQPEPQPQAQSQSQQHKTQESRKPLDERDRQNMRDKSEFFSSYNSMLSQSTEESTE